MVVESTEAYLHAQASKTSGDVAATWNKLKEEYSNRLWYQFSTTLGAALQSEPFLASLDAVQLYKQCLDPIQDKLNAVVLASFVHALYKRIKDHESARAFLEEAQKAVRATPAATCLVRTALLQLALSNKDANNSVVNIDQVRIDREALSKDIDKLPGITPAHAPFFLASSVYYREVGDYAAYYAETLRYLGCVNIDSIPAQEQLMLAICMSVAAMLGSSIYNFGELLAHPILNALDTDAHRWLLTLLRAFNAGDFAEYKRLKGKAFAQFPDLASNEEQLVDKIQMLGIMELAFERGGASSTRALKFDEIAARCELPADEVEAAAMKCMARGLVRGSIDGVHRVLKVDWLQPRVLDANQIRKLASRIDQWAKDVNEAGKVVEHRAAEILVKQA